MPPDPKQVQSLFLQAVQVPEAAARAELLGRAALEPELRQRVEALLRAHDNPDSFLDQPIAPLELLVGQNAARGSPDAHQSGAGLPDRHWPMAAPTSGTMVGDRYVLLEMIGEGGMGAVWVAEQRAPVRRRVALKLVKAGMDSRTVLARFEAERQALAMMDHPNIARVFDGGTTEHGYPFFVMELVKGTPLMQYCDERELSIRQRLFLFVQICQAVQHAHQKGVIHRDLKPGNLLVTEMDGEAVAKVIDFGLAKALQGTEALTEHTLYTVLGGVAGTPLYMAPEQVALNALDVDTRTDIYALGIVLYELLTGTTPLQRERLKQARWEDIRRLISEEDAPRPSTRISSSAALPAIAHQRHTEPRTLRKLFRGELDWIVLKALEKDRSRRYQTANALARDIERFLSDERVEAYPPSAAYRFRKFARRNRGALLAGTVVLSMLLLLVVALSLSNVRIARERNAKAEALRIVEAERQRAESNFVKARTAIASLIAQPAAGMYEWSQLPPVLRKKFAEEAGKYYQNLLAEGSLDPTLQYETAVGYRSLGYLYYRLKEFEPAEKFLRESIGILDPLGGQHPDHPEYRQQAGWSRLVLAWVLAATSRAQEAQTAFEGAARIYEKLIDQNPRNAEYPDELYWCYQGIIPSQLAPEGVDESEMLRRAGELLARIRPPTICAPMVHGRVGNYYAAKGDWDEAIASYRRGLELFRQQEPQARIKQSLTARRIEHEVALANALIDSGRPSGWSEAIEVLERAAADRPGDAALLRALGLLQTRLGRWTEAAAALARAVEVVPDDAQSWYALATLRLMAGDVQAYRQTCREMFMRFGGTHDAAIAGRVALTCSLGEGAVEDTAGLLRLADRAPTDGGVFVNVRGVAEYRLGHYGKAVDSLHPQADVTPEDLIGFATLGMARQRLGQPQEAAAALANAREIDQKIGADPALGQPLPCQGTLHLVQARILLREAEQLVTASTLPAAEPLPAATDPR